MVGPGTGVAPFRAAIQERVAQGQRGNFLFFGCRRRDQDFYWEAEWTELEQKGCLTLVTAFSREQEQKVYVQHRLRERGPLVWELLDRRGACFCLAGGRAGSRAPTRLPTWPGCSAPCASRLRRGPEELPAGHCH
uniref:NADPH dependent diflavin oxidoreductase 1 n=2 Tax=Molossus molossus TaxID=27622 RepID=A0A7J8EER7_MOLMO|nr:NADPH dependent diflavin oxidoreductase 1 [Molossus molossus]